MNGALAVIGSPKAASRWAGRLEARALQGRCAWLLAADLAASVCAADVRVVVQTRATVGRGGDVATSRARKMACYLACIVANLSERELARASGLDRKTIRVHLGWCEDERDQPSFDRLIGELETAMLQMAAQMVLGRLGATA